MEVGAAVDFRSVRGHGHGQVEDGSDGRDGWIRLLQLRAEQQRDFGKEQRPQKIEVDLRLIDYNSGPK